MEHKITAKNGIDIYAYPNEHLHGFTICLYVRAGCLYETEEENGITHFWEHVVIRNINYLMGGELYRELDRLGLEFNACTYKEFVQFEISGARCHFCEGASLIARLFEPISLPAKEIDVERRRIKAEIRESDEESTLSFFTGQLIWEETALARTITGTYKNLDKIGKKVLAAAHQTYLSREHLFFYVTGGVGTAELQDLARHIESYQIGSSVELRNNMAPVPGGFFHRNAMTAIKNSADSVIRFSFDLDMTRHSLAEYILLYDILFDCENAKVHQELSEKLGYIYSFDPSLEQYSNVGNLAFQYEVKPGKLLDSVSRVVALLQELKAGIREELDYVRAAYIDNAELALDHAETFNWTQAYENHILNQGYTDLETRIQQYAQVTPEALTRLAREVFVPDRLIVTIKGKKEEKQEEAVRALVMKL